MLLDKTSMLLFWPFSTVLIFYTFSNSKWFVSYRVYNFYPFFAVILNRILPYNHLGHLQKDQSWHSLPHSDFHNMSHKNHLVLFQKIIFSLSLPFLKNYYLLLLNLVSLF